MFSKFTKKSFADATSRLTGALNEALKDPIKSLFQEKDKSSLDAFVEALESDQTLHMSSNVIICVN